MTLHSWLPEHPRLCILYLIFLLLLALQHDMGFALFHVLNQWPVGRTFKRAASAFNAIKNVKLFRGLIIFRLNHLAYF